MSDQEFNQFNTEFSPFHIQDGMFENSPDYQKLRVIRATVDYFICIFGQREALQLTRMDNPSANQINEKTIDLALEDAFVYMLNFYKAATTSGKTLIQSSFRRTQAIIARYYLDVLNPRDSVKEAYETAIKQLEIWAGRGGKTNLVGYTEAYKFYRDQPYSQGASLVRGSYERGRKFTEATLEPWVEMYQANNLSRYFRWREQRAQGDYGIGAGIGANPEPNPDTGTVTPTGTFLPEACEEQINPDTIDCDNLGAEDCTNCPDNLVIDP